MGYICHICRKFYHSTSGAQLSHCKSLAHFENLQVTHTLFKLMGLMANGHLPATLDLSPSYTPQGGPAHGGTEPGWGRALSAVVLGGVAEGQAVSSRALAQGG